MYLSLNKKYRPAGVCFVIIHVDGFTQSIYELEKETGLTLDAKDILKEITDCIQYKMCALVELEMYCLSLLEKQCHSDRDDDVMKIIRLFIHTGKLIYQECIDHGLYIGDRLAFAYSNSIMDNLLLIERKSMINSIHEEFKPISIRHTASLLRPW
jgi:hypothetical protein